MSVSTNRERDCSQSVKLALSTGALELRGRTQGCQFPLIEKGIAISL